jgi:hypothetical protein
MLFNFMTNLGSNAQTYLLAGEVFPTRVRGMGAGFAAAFAKIGAVTTAFLFPHSTGRYRNSDAPLHPGRNVSAGRRHHLGLPDRDHRHQSRNNRPITQLMRKMGVQSPAELGRLAEWLGPA